jgi:hypothetical protein
MLNFIIADTHQVDVVLLRAVPAHGGLHGQIAKFDLVWSKRVCKMSVFKL